MNHAKRMARWAWSFAAAALLAVVVGCGGGGGGSTVPPAGDPPTITAQPSNQDVNEGSTATLSITANGSLPLSYQWKKGAVDVVGATQSSYTTPALTASDDGAQYSVQVSNSHGSRLSATATVRVKRRPTITTQPVSTTVTEGQTATFTVVASGSTPMSYLWHRNGTAIAGATQASYTTPATVLSDSGAQFTVVVANSAGSVTSQAATLTVLSNAVAPTITGQPSSIAVTEGQPASFTVTVSGTAPLSYQWYKGTSAIPSATQATLAFAAAQVSDAGSYKVVVTNAVGSVESSPATLAVNTPVSITAPPVSQTVTEGQNVTFSVTAAGTGPLTYQWQKDAANLSGQTGTSLTLTNVQSAQAGSYRVVVTGAAGPVTSTAATLTVNVPVAITALPTPQTVTVGQNVTFSVTATGTGPITYQWQKDAANLSGQTGSSLTLTNVQISDAGSYRVVVTGAAGAVTSNAASLTVNVPVTITSSPASQTVTVGQTATFTVTATGTGPFTYQWQKNTTNLVGQTGSTLTLTNVQASDAGSYLVVVTGAAGPVTSEAATLTVDGADTAPAITIQPSNLTVIAPDAPTFTVVASGTNLSYQWKKNGTDIAGATSASYTVPGFTDLQTVLDSYSVVVSNSVGSVTSSSATFTVVAPNPTYLPGGEPTAVASRPLTVLPSLNVDPVKFPNGSFRFGYDEALKNPAWTAYADFKVNTTYPNSTGDYKTDTRLAAPQVGKTDMGTHGGAGFYLSNGLGFDRGHMVTRSDVSYRYGPQAGDDATYMSNLIPQVSYYNQRIWNDLEEAVGGKSVSGAFSNGVTATFGRVWVYSGPVFTGTTQYWVPSTETYTTNPGALPGGTLTIAIPTACYKIVVAAPVEGQTLPRVMAWMSSNRAYATSESVDLWKYVTSVKRIEDLTGLNFFPNFPADEATTNWKSAVDVRGWGTSFEKSSGPNVHILKPSWDLIPITGNPVLTGDPVSVNTPVAFEGLATPNAAGGTVNTATCTWNFGDGSPTTTGLTTSHSYSAAGSYTVTFSATDSLNQTSTITRAITVVAVAGNAAPTTSPSTLADVSGTVGLAVPPVNFTVNDDTTPAGSLVVTATSSNPTLILDSGLGVVNSNGSVTLTLTPNAGEIGNSTITVTVADGDGAQTVRSFTLSVAANSAPTFTPSTLPDVSTDLSVTKVVNFTVADDLTAAASISLVATSGDQNLLPDASVSVVNSNGSVTLTMIPAAGQSGSVLVTVVATDGNGLSTTRAFTLTVNPAATSGFTEGFESNVKGSYTVADAVLPSGTWSLDDALIGNLANDKKNGSWSVRVRNTGKVTMKFDHAAGAKTVSVQYAKYGTDATCTWQMWYSTDAGLNWTQAGTDMTSEPTALTAATFTINHNGPVRFEIRKTSGGTARINFDDFQVVGY